MTNGECIYRKTVDFMSRMALEKDDFRRFSVTWEFRVTGKLGRGARCTKVGNGPLRKRVSVSGGPSSRLKKK